MKPELTESLEKAASDKNRPDLGINSPSDCSEPMGLVMTVLLQSWVVQHKISTLACAVVMWSYLLQEASHMHWSLCFVRTEGLWLFKSTIFAKRAGRISIWEQVDLGEGWGRLEALSWEERGLFSFLTHPTRKLLEFSTWHPTQVSSTPWGHCLQFYFLSRSELYRQSSASPAAAALAAAPFPSCCQSQPASPAHQSSSCMLLSCHQGKGRCLLISCFPLPSLNHPTVNISFCFFPDSQFFFFFFKQELVCFLIGKPFLALRQHELLSIFSCCEGTWPGRESFEAAEEISPHDLFNPWPPLLQSTPQVPSSMTITICCLGIKHWLNTSFCIGHWTGRMFSKLSSWSFINHLWCPSPWARQRQHWGAQSQTLSKCSTILLKL